MSCRRWILGGLLLSIFWIGGFPQHGFCQDIVRAKIDIQLETKGGKVRAKTRDRLHAGDHFRIYVIPEQDVNVYFVYSDEKTASLVKQVKAGYLDNLALPNLDDAYEIDGASDSAWLTIICSPGKIDQVDALFHTPTVSHEAWKQLETQLIQRSKIVLSQAQPKPFGIAGNVRTQSRIAAVNPGHQTSREGESVALSITAEAPTSPLTFGAANLPAGLRIDATTGAISGAVASGAAAHSPYRVEVSIASPSDHTSVVFAWTVVPDPFFQSLRIVSGKSLVVRTYAFRISP